MKKYIVYFVLILVSLQACNNGYNSAFKNIRKGPRKSAPTGKYRNPTIFSRVNPFQGKAKARLAKSKRKKKKLFKRKHKQRGKARVAKKPGSSFKMKRTVSRSRLKSSGSRIKKGNGSKSKRKNLFNTRKK